MLSPTGIDEWGTRVIEAGEDVVRDSSFDDTRKARWLQDLKMGYSGPVAGVILHLLPNLQQLELRNPLIHLSDTFGPLFGEYCREFSGKDYIHRHYPVTRPPRAGTLEGMGSALGLQNLETLKLSTLFHPNLYGPTCLPRIKDLNLTLKTYNGGPDTQTPYTPDRRIEMQHIETLRVDLRIDSVEFKPFATLVALTDVMPCLTSTRKVHFYAEAPDYNHNGDFGSHYFSGSDWNCYEDSYERRSYHELVTTLGPLCDQIEDLQLPGGFWSLITETAWEPVDLRHLTKLQKLTVPKAAIMGAAARPRHKDWSKGDYGRRELNDYNWWAENPDERYEDHNEPKEPGPYVPTHSPIDVLPTTLQRLTIFEADETVCEWLKDMFRHKNYYFEELETVELVVTDEKLEDNVAEMEGKLKEMAMGWGVVVSVKLDTTTIGGPDGK
jgi:hypothetical protein